MSKKDFNLTDEQRAIIDAVKSGVIALDVDAGAGCGKTSTMRRLIEAVAEVNPKAKITGTAFNKRAAKDFDNQICHLRGDEPDYTNEKSSWSGPIQARTVHSLAFEVLRSWAGRKSIKITNNKYGWLAGDWILNAHGYRDSKEANQHFKFYDANFELRRVIDLIRQQLAISRDSLRAGRPTPDELAHIEDIMARFNLFPEAWLERGNEKGRALTNIVQAAVEVLKKSGEGLEQPRLEIDLQDQIWALWWLDVRESYYPELDLFIFDEAQDVSPDKMVFVDRQRSKSKQFVFVHDPKQVIYAWAGSSLWGAQPLSIATNALKMALSINFRCAAKFIEIANGWNPTLRPRPGAPEGVFATMFMKEFFNKYIDTQGNVLLDKNSDVLILSPKNAPLASLASRLLSMGIPMKILGREIGIDLVEKLDKIVEAATRPNGKGKGSWVELLPYAKNVKEVQRHLGATFHDVGNFEYSFLVLYIENHYRYLLDLKLEAGASESHLAEVEDEKQTLLNFVREANVREYLKLRIFILNLFDDEKGNFLLGSTVHKAKGAEAKVIYMLMDDEGNNYPRAYAKSAAALTEEYNLLYVAVTRAKEELYYLMENSKVVAPSFPYDWFESMKRVEAEASLPPALTQAMVEEGRQAVTNHQHVIEQVRQDLDNFESELYDEYGDPDDGYTTPIPPPVPQELSHIEKLRSLTLDLD